MSFIIGLEDTSSTTTQGINGSAYTCDSRLSAGLVHQASSGDQVTEVGVRVEQKAASRDYRIAIYEYDDGTEEPTGAPIYESGDLTAGAVDGVEENLTVTGLNVALTAGTWYIVSVGEVNGQLGAVVYADGGGYYGLREDSIGASMPSPWAGGGANSRAIAVYAKGVSNVGLLTTDKAAGLVVGKS